MASSPQTLTPLEFVELGYRITRDEAEDKHKIDFLIAEARTGVQAVVTSLDSAWGSLGGDEHEVSETLLPDSAFSYADLRPRRDPDRIRGRVKFPAELTVLEGTSVRRSVKDRRGIVLGSYRFLLFGDVKQDRIFSGIHHLTYEHIGHTGDYWDYWSEAGRVDPDVPVFTKEALPSLRPTSS